MTHHARVDLLELIGSALCLGLPAVEAILEFKEGLPHRVGKGHLG